MGLVKEALARVSRMVGKDIDARDVLEPNAKTRRSFKGHVVGRFKRTGPNSWDDYRVVAEDGGPIDVYPSVRVHVEPRGAKFRMRSRGEVVMVTWIPSDEEIAEMGADADVHQAFLETCVEEFGHKAGIGVTAFIAKTLRR